MTHSWPVVKSPDAHNGANNQTGCFLAGSALIGLFGRRLPF
ncbi:MAG: hypothetical protein ACFFDI_30380 [Promethearchaeota archaeon]